MKTLHLKNKLDKFLFSNTNYLPKDIFRITLGLFCLLQALFIFPDLLEIYGKGGIIRESINETILKGYTLRLSWFTDSMEVIGLSEQVSISLLFSIYCMVLFFMIIKSYTFIAALSSWLIHLTFFGASYTFAYGVDYFVIFALFINIFFCMDSVIGEKRQAIIDSFFVRLLQIQLCFIYFFAGFGKILGTDWLDGNALWKVINGFNASLIPLMEWFADFPLLFVLAGWGIIVIELCYPFLLLKPSFRKATLLAIITMHLMIGVMMGLYFFAAIMIILNIAGFGHFLIDKTTLNKKAEAFKNRPLLIKFLNLKN